MDDGDNSSARAVLKAMEMNIDLRRAGKPPRTLRKLLRDLPSRPAPEAVHQVRTQIRKLEAILHAVSPESGKGMARVDGCRILKVLKPIRRAAGRVRDMDVLIAKATSLTGKSDGVVRLIEHLARMREADAARIHRKVKHRRAEARSLLKGLRRAWEKMELPSHAMEASSAPLQILAEKLDHWPRLNQENLHDFRKGVKELRYMLQLAPSQGASRLDAYARVKDTVGDWHDWLELKCAAESVLIGEEDEITLQEIRRLVDQKLQGALRAANSLRSRGIHLTRVA
ncbi:CHAD domain-containing protein [Acidobacteria bacterium AB60]|nr:CHAD domain-containing protein [Acidobacteria bacterium AB60]